METLGTILAIINIAAIIPFLFMVAVLVLSFVLMLAGAIFDQAPRKIDHSYDLNQLGASGT